MTVGRALNEVKLIESRIQKKIGAAQFTDAYQVKTKKLWRNHDTKENFEKNAKAEFDSITDLIDRRNNIKTAILVSNATTKVKVDGKEFVVIEAIERKRAILHDQRLLARLREDFSFITKLMDKNEAELKENILKMLQQSVSDDRLRDKGDYEKLAAPFREDNELKLIDPLGIRKKIEEYDETIDRFITDVDYALSESNATTKIEF